MKTEKDFQESKRHLAVGEGHKCTLIDGDKVPSCLWDCYKHPKCLGKPENLKKFLEGEKAPTPKWYLWVCSCGEKARKPQYTDRQARRLGANHVFVCHLGNVIGFNITLEEVDPNKRNSTKDYPKKEETR